jgi:Asp-tRNA(Asn)/Glu-tRNA(Gln) amidotransferase A subunit family amidase
MREALHYQFIVDISAALKAGKLSAVDLLEAMLERIAALEPKLHSYLLVTAEAARAEAKTAAAEIASGRYRGPLHGVPIAFKGSEFHQRRRDDLRHASAQGLRTRLRRNARA